MFGFREASRSRARQIRGELAVITPSYAGDFALFERLHESVVRLSPDITHHAVSSGRRMSYFRPA